MKRALTTPEAVKAYRDGETVYISITGFFKYNGNIRTMTERRTLKAGSAYITGDGDEITPHNFTNALNAVCAFVSEWILYDAEKYHYSFTIGTDDPERDYYNPFL